MELDLKARDPAPDWEWVTVFLNQLKPRDPQERDRTCQSADAAVFGMQPLAACFAGGAETDNCKFISLKKGA